MKRLIGCAALGLVACILFQATASGGGGGPGIRPDHFSAKATMVIDPTGHWVYVDSGVGTHTGPETNFGTGSVNGQAWATGTGTSTSASGDQIFWDLAGPFGGPVLVTFTGGTGRFANVSGELTIAPPGNPVTIQHGPLTIIRYDATGEGWISY